MYIKYTYKDVERPIELAEFKSSADGDCFIQVRSEDVAINVPGRNFSFADFASLTALVNRINRQIGNEG